MNTLAINSTQTHVPGSFEELSTAQLCYVATRLMRTNGIHPLAAKLLFTQRLLNISWLRPRMFAWWWLWLTPEERYRCTALAEFLLVQPPKMNSFVIQHIKAGSTKLHAPGERLEGVNAEQWGTADGLYLAYEQSRNPEVLRLFVATLYTPTGTEYNPTTAAHLAEKLQKRSTELLQAIAFNYRAVRFTLPEYFPYVFGTGENKGGSTPWGEVMLERSGHKFGDYQSTRRAPAWAFLTDLNKQIKQQKNQQANT